MISNIDHQTINLIFPYCSINNFVISLKGFAICKTLDPHTDYLIDGINLRRALYSFHNGLNRLISSGSLTAILSESGITTVLRISSFSLL